MLGMVDEILEVEQEVSCERVWNTVHRFPPVSVLEGSTRGGGPGGETATECEP